MDLVLFPANRVHRQSDGRRQNTGRWHLPVEIGHCLTIDTPTSNLFWWPVAMISTFHALPDMPKSSRACLTAVIAIWAGLIVQHTDPGRRFLCQSMTARCDRGRFAWQGTSFHECGMASPETKTAPAIDDRRRIRQSIRRVQAGAKNGRDGPPSSVLTNVTFTS